MSFIGNVFSREQPESAELYVFTFSNAASIRYTSFDRDLTAAESWDGNYYTHIPIKRSEISLDSELSSNPVTITAPQLNTFAGSLIQGGTMWLSIVKMFLIDKSYRVIFNGPVLSVKKSLGEAEATCENLMFYLGKDLPHVFFQSACNNTLFDDFCTLVQSGFATSSSGSIRVNGYGKAVIFTMATRIDTVNGITIPQGGSLDADGNAIKNFWTYGRITVGGEMRAISSCNPSGDLSEITGADLDAWGVAYNLPRNGDESDVDYRVRLTEIGERTIFFHYPFSATYSNPVTVSLLPGCDKTPSFCKSVFDNLINFVGFPYFPASDPTVLPVGTQD